MFDVQVPEETIAQARRIVATHNFGRRGVADGNQDQQVTGLIGQIVMHDLFRVERPDGSEGPDGGVDFVYTDQTIDVKTMGRNVRPLPHHVNNFVGLQKHFATDLLLFCSFNKRTSILTVCGWIEKEEFLRRASLFPAGTIRTRTDGSTFRAKADLYEIENCALNSPRTLGALKAELKGLSSRSRLAA